MIASWRLLSALSLAGLAAVVSCGSSDDTAAGGGAGATGLAGGAGTGGSGTAGTTSAAGKGGVAGAAAGKSGAAGTAGGGGSGAGGAGLGGSAGAGGASAGAGGSAGKSGGSGSAGTAAGAAGTGGATGCATPCTQPGEVCVNGSCVEDCRLPGSVACGAATVCDVGSDHPGQCVDPHLSCVITNPTVACGTGTCGPGTTCGVNGTCLPELPCTEAKCSGGHCWGEACPCTRPAPTCAAPPLGKPGDVGTLNDPAFARNGANANEGLIDLQFDPSCNAWGVTFISGPDYLRKIDPTGKVSSFTGVTNLNMGEVAVLLGKDGMFGGGMGDVALTYICCAACGCILTGSGGNPQGAAYYDAATGTLPMKIPSVDYTMGTGPFGDSGLDTGPYGLTWGLDRVLYVGNVKTNGDYQALDLVSGKITPLAALPARVVAAAPFDHDRLLVATVGGVVQLVAALGVTAPTTPLVTLPAEVTSIARDPWSGRIYAELSNLSVVSFKSDGTDVQTFTKVPNKGRMALGPDGNLYHLSVYPVAAEVVSFPLPTTF